MPKHPGEKPPLVREPGAFIPNSYQTPNDYADRYMHLLTGDEWKVLSYTVRRTFGFGRYDRPEDHISVSQYQQGKRSRETGEMLDHGTGLSRATIIKALAALCKFHLLTFVAPNDIRTNEGDCYSLQLVPSKVDLDAMLARVEEKRAANTQRTSAARSRTPRHRANTHTPSPITYQTPGKSDIPPPVSGTYQPETPEPVSPTAAPQYVPHTAPGKSDLHTIPRGKPEENQNTHTHHAAQPPATPPANGNGVRVSDDLTFDDFLAYARSKRSFTAPEAWAKKANRERAPEDVQLVREWMAGQAPDAVAQSLVAQPKPRVTFREALLHVKSVLGVNPDTDYEGLINSLDIDDQVRTELRAKESALRPTARASP